MKKIFGILILLAVASISATTTSAMGSKSPSAPSTPPSSKYSYLDPRHEVPQEALQKATDYFDANKSRFSNQNYITVIDFTKYSGNKRFFVVDMKTGSVESFFVAHGLGSDPNYTGYADSFSNTPESKKTSLGFYKTAETYSGDHGYSLRLDGLSSTNSNARDRDIVVHGASYVDASLQKMGRSWGCPALPLNDYTHVISMIKGGSLMYAWHQ